MTKWQWAGLGLIVLMLGCAGSSYQYQGDSYFAQKEYEKAMQTYIRTLQVQDTGGQRMIRYAPDIMTRIGISALQMNMVDGAIKVFNYVIKKTPDYAPAYFFLGVCQEKKNNIKQAQEMYAKYISLPTDDISREAMKARLYYLQQQQYIKEARLLAARGPGVQTNFPTQRMVVLDFNAKNFSQNEIIIAKGLASLVIDDLNRLGGFHVVPRDKMVQLMKSMGWSDKDLKNAQNIETLQQLLGVGTVVHGEIILSGGGNVQIKYRTITFTGIRNVKESETEGNINAIVVLQKKIVLGILKDINVQLSASQVNILKIPATRSAEAFFDYAYALHALDLQQFETAQMYLKNAVKKDPQFTLADKIFCSPEVFIACQTSNLSVLNVSISQMLRIIREGPAGDTDYDALASVKAIDRLQEMGWYLDAGFIPGNDSRDGIEEIDPDALRDLFPDIDGGLSDPPDPPHAVDPWYLPDPPPPPHRP